MNNVVILFKNEEGDLFCRQITKEGIKYMAESKKSGFAEPFYWEEGGTILMEELEEILDRQV
jgi:hypothetical protein